MSQGGWNFAVCLTASALCGRITQYIQQLLLGGSATINTSLNVFFFKCMQFEFLNLIWYHSCSHVQQKWNVRG